MPMRRRATRNSRPPSRTMSWPRKWISPAVGSTSRLMQRTSVDLPVPDGPMIAVSPRPSMSSETFLRTGSPARYSLRRLRMTRERSMSRPIAVRTDAVASMGPRRPYGSGLGLLLLGEFGGLALGLRVVGRLVVGRAGAFRDVAHHLPGLLVGDRD